MLVVALQMPPTPHERDFYEELLAAMEAVSFAIKS